MRKDLMVAYRETKALIPKFLLFNKERNIYVLYLIKKRFIFTLGTILEWISLSYLNCSKMRKGILVNLLIIY